MPDPLAFIAGATGYTGRAVVDVLRAREIAAVPHVRPDSSARDRWSRRWRAQGAQPDATPWQLTSLTRTLTERAPTLVFALLGTTRSRARSEGRGAVDAYEAVDYGLTMMLYEAAAACGHRPRFVYLSAAGLREGTRNPYMAVRVRVERALREGSLPYTIARPSFITGSDRDESRPGERVGAAVADGVLTLAGWLGAGRLRDRYQSMDSTALARGLVEVALDPAFENEIAEAEQLRARA